MKKHQLFIIFLNLFLLANYAVFSQAQKRTEKIYRFVNGQWFDGKGFRRETFYSANGILTKKKPVKIDEEIDLKNGFVIPPLADAHCHHFDGARQINQQVEMYLRDGIFYAKVLNNFRTGAEAVSAQVNKPSSVDVSYAHGALTGTDSFPIDLYEGIGLGYYTSQQQQANAVKIWASRRQENDAYYIIDNAADLSNKWSRSRRASRFYQSLYAA